MIQGMEDKIFYIRLKKIDSSFYFYFLRYISLKSRYIKAQPENFKYNLLSDSLEIFAPMLIHTTLIYKKIESQSKMD